MRASPDTGISTRAVPRLIGASTVALPAASVLVKLTTVPSGTLLPLQSRTGSVCTKSFPETHSDLIRKLQASEATWRTTRSSDALATDAPIFAGPSLAADVSRIQDTPFEVGCECVSAEPCCGIALNSTLLGESTRLWNLSKTKATALMAFGVATRTRDGCTNRLNLEASLATT